MSKSLAEKFIKNSTSIHVQKLSDDKYVGDVTTTDVPMINVALSGKLDGGLTCGLTTIAGPSKHFKSNVCLLLLSAYMKKHKDSICLFYDSEFGAAAAYFEGFGIDPDRVVHTPIENIEQLKFDLANQLNEIERGDKVFVFIDSVGNLASKKEINDAMDEKAVADLTRAKEMKSLFRIVTPMVNLRDIPLVVVAHTYDTLESYSKKVVSGGTGIYYSSNTVLIMGRRQVKDGKEVTGYDFMLNADKSRTIKEKSIIPLSVSYDEGVSKFSGLLDVALRTGHIIKPKMGWYQRLGVVDDKNWRAKESNCEEFWAPLFDDETFVSAVSDLYLLSGTGNFTEEDLDNE